MSGSTSNCKRCGKEFSGPACPFCTVTGVDLEALLSAEEMKLLRSEEQGAPVSLVDMVSGKAIAVATPLCKIGRDLSNDIPLAGDRSMSRFHFQIRQEGQEYFIEDCGSRNGTFLNGSPIAIPRKLQNSDIVSAGISRYRFSVQSSEAEENGIGSGGGNNAEPELSPSGANLSEQEISLAREALEKLKGTVQDTQGKEGSGNRDADDADAIAAGNATIDDMPVLDQHTAPTIDHRANASAAARKHEDQRFAALAKRGPTELPNPPAWLDEFLFPELQKLMGEKERLNGLLEEIRQDIKQIDRKIVSAQSVSQALLSASGPELAQACKQVFDAVDWFAEFAQNNPFEINLKTASKIDAVVRIVICKTDPSPKDFEALVNQQAVVWCQSNLEPKGIMVVQVKPDEPPSQRPALGREFLESMRRKKICVIQPAQMLMVYRQVCFAGQDKASVKQLFQNTCGPLPGFAMKPQDSKAATA